MRWRVELYHERRGILDSRVVEAPLPAEAVRLAWKAVLAEYPSIPRSGRVSLFERAERVGGRDASGWALYRIVKHGDQGSIGVAPGDAA